MLPIEGLGNQGHRGGPAAAEQDGADRHAPGILPLRRHGRALAGGNGEAGVGVRRGLLGRRGPVAAAPVGQVRRRRLGQPLPPYVAIVGQRHIGVDAVGRERVDGVLVGGFAGPGRHAEEAVFRVDGVEPSVVAEAHPGDVVAHGLSLPAFDGGLQHGQIGLAAGAGEGGGDVLHQPFRRGELEDEHVLGQPALVAGHDRGDAQSVALLAEQGVAAIAGAIRPDFPGFGEVDDVLRFIAGPGHVLLARR